MAEVKDKVVNVQTFKNIYDTIIGLINGKANNSHKHSATDVNSGVIAIINGGTNATTAAQARVNLGVESLIFGLSNRIDGILSVMDSNKEAVNNKINMTTHAVTLSSTGWSNFSQTKTGLINVTSDSVVIIGSAPESNNVCQTCNIYCSAQGSGSLTFSCTTVPSSNVTMNVIVLHK